MSRHARSGLFVAEGTSDQPLAELVESLFCERGIELSLSQPAFERLTGVGKDVKSRVRAGLELTHGPVDLIVVHRDADSAGYAARLREIKTAVAQVSPEAALVPIIPVRMTEAWLLLDEAAIRKVAENPTGRARLGLPKIHEVESVANPKMLLHDYILAAADVSGRRRERIKARFNDHRRHLLATLDPAGPVRRLSGWQRLLDQVDLVVKGWQ
ncbi:MULTISPECIES: hypothetical protein [unclassified Micromonospora]|uniref:hypothetical protein n=1 Tax=unclassified Micromonospora TaxID=2617518 RepID=UPI0036304E69